MDILCSGTSDCVGTLVYQLSFNNIPDTTSALTNRIARTNVCSVSGIFAQGFVEQNFQDQGVRVITISKN